MRTLTTPTRSGAFSLSVGAGVVSEREYELTENIFRVTRLEVRHIIVPQPDINFLSLEHSLEDNLRQIEESQHTRHPVCDIGLESTVGSLHTKDLLGPATTSSTTGCWGYGKSPPEFSRHRGE